MTSLEAAKDRLEQYVTQLATHPMQRLDIAKLQNLEAEIVMATRAQAIWDPF